MNEPKAPDRCKCGRVVFPEDPLKLVYHLRGTYADELHYRAPNGTAECSRWDAASNAFVPVQEIRS